MNEVTLARSSSVAVQVRHGKPYTLRCFECEWGVTETSWKDALEAGIDHEQLVHGLSIHAPLDREVAAP